MQTSPSQVTLPTPPSQLFITLSRHFAGSHVTSSMERGTQSLRRRANARNVSFRISLRWPIHIINQVDKTKLPCYTTHRRSTTVSLETYPSIPSESNLLHSSSTLISGPLLEEFRKLTICPTHLPLEIKRYQSKLPGIPTEQTYSIP